LRGASAAPIAPPACAAEGAPLPLLVAAQGATQGVGGCKDRPGRPTTREYRPDALDVSHVGVGQCACAAVGAAERRGAELRPLAAVVAAAVETGACEERPKSPCDARLVHVTRVRRDAGWQPRQRRRGVVRPCL